MEAGPDEGYSAFVETKGARLRRALVAAYGLEVGVEASADALEYGWQHWGRVAAMDNPAGYLYRVGQSKARRYRRRPAKLPAVPETHLPWIEPSLPEALEGLSVRQRQAVILCHGYGWTLAEVAELWGTGRSTVQKQIERAMGRLREHLGVDDA